MEMHFATLWEAYADAIPDVPAVVMGETSTSWKQYENRAARLACALSAAGLGPDDKVGLYLYNSTEYLEAHFAAFKQRIVPINVNFRYLGGELEYLLDNADCKALFYHSSLADRVAQVASALPKLTMLIEVNDGPSTADVPGKVVYEELLSNYLPAPRITRDENDVYMLYTGGTTGMPKGVMYRIGELTRGFTGNGAVAVGLALGNDLGAFIGEVAQQRSDKGGYVCVPCCPLMHGTGMWLGTMIPHCVGATVVLLQNRKFDPHELLELIDKERVNTAVIVGDAFARPIADALDAAKRAGKNHDLSSLSRMTSSGVMWTKEVKQRLLDHVPQIMLVDGMGSTEGGMALSITTAQSRVETAKFSMNPTTKVFDEEDIEVVPGDGRTGKVANGGLTPFGYFKDEEKSARTFRVINGVRYSFPGDLATFDDNGQFVLLGRGSQVINTAGEKVFPEEVEEAVKRFAGVQDCLVVGLPDEKFGQIVVAVASTQSGATIVESDVIAHVKTQLSGYKAPKRVIVVHEVPRAANGKADYPSATALAQLAMTPN